MLPIIRTFISLPAGVARMPFWRFTCADARRLHPLGLRAWPCSAGRSASNWDDWKDRLHYLDYAVLAAIVALIVYC